MSANPVASVGNQYTVDGVSSLLSHARSLIADRGYGKPLLLMSIEQVKANAQRFMTALPGIHPHFAVKSNPDPRVLDILHKQGVSFEIASLAELQLLLGLGVVGEEVFYSNPIKSEGYLHQAAKSGVQWYAVDSVAEVQKIYRIYPGASLYLRIKISNDGSAWPLDKKFGVEGQEAYEVLNECVRLNMDMAGITFHVGSQCLNINNWQQGIRSSRLFFRWMVHHGLTPRLLNLGGGFPVRLNSKVSTLEEIGRVIIKELEAMSPSIKVIAEPGRNLVASAGCIIAQVVGSAIRNGQKWLYLDTGIYSGLMELNDRFHYPIFTDRHGPMSNWTLAGPTCDSIDICVKNQQLPEAMQSGDLIYLPYMGAYTACCATEFNGFPIPEVVLI
jgi:ornithine decarboxylase